jgi:lipopolysaccharide transport system permease protein
MVQYLTRLFSYRGLLWTLALGELKARHRQTLLGMFWALAQPVAMMLVFTVVFSVFVRVPVEGTPYALFAYTGLVSWLFFANLLSTGILSVVANMNLVTKAGFPREVIPLSKVVTIGFDFLVGLALLGILLAVYGIPITWAILAVPAIVVIQVMFATGLVLLGSAAYVLQRDIGSLLPLLLQIWMFLSPVVYPVSLIPDQYRSLYMLNPMATIIEAYRSAILMGTAPSLALMTPALVIASVVLAAGYAYFKTVEPRFADVM